MKRNRYRLFFAGICGMDTADCGAIRLISIGGNAGRGKEQRRHAKTET